MKRNIVLFLALTSWMLFSCNKESEPIEVYDLPKEAVSEHVLTVKATIGDASDTKTAVQPDGTSIFWTPGDAINLFYGTANSGKFTTAIDEPALTTDFNGTLSVATGTSTESGVTTQNFWGVYPYNAGNTCTGDGVALTIPTNQSGIAGTFTDKLNPSVATSPGLSLAFYNVGSWFIFSVTEEDVVSATLTGHNNESLAGRIKVTMDGETRRPASEILEGVNSIVMTPEGGEFEVGKQYYMVVIPQVMEHGLELSLTKSDGTTATWSIDSRVTFIRSQYLRKLNADNGIAYTSISIPNNEIWYTSPSGTVIEPYFNCSWVKNGSIVSNTVVDGVGKLVFSGNIDIIPSQAFYQTGYSSIQLPQSVTTIQDKVFYNCTNLETVEMPSVVSISNYNFYNCSKLKELTLPASLTTLGVNSFHNCPKLTDVTINTSTNFRTEGLAYLFNGAAIQTFRGPYATDDGKYIIINNDLVMAAGKNMENAVIPSGVTTIQPYVFYAYSSLTHAVLPSSVTTIGGFSFYNCYSLEDIIIQSDTPASFHYGDDAFTRTNDCPILVPNGRSEDYKAAWSKYSNRIGSRIEEIPINLCKNGRANCYIVNDAGNYQFTANKMGNSDNDVSPGIPSSVEILWESTLTPPIGYYDYGFSHESGTLISDIRLENNHIVFTSTGNEGNALVAVKNSADKILWSWHLWFISNPIEEVSNPTGTATFMDRNLGALNNDIEGTWGSYKNKRTYGMLYQWGRKDPFIADDESLWDYVVSTNEDAITVVQHPTTLYDSFSGAYWSDSKTMVDPCPPGWRVPSVNSWPIMKSGTDYYTYSDNLSNCYWSWVYELNGYGLRYNDNWYPAAGHITKQGSEYLHDKDYYTSGRTYGYYWAASEGGYTTPYLYIEFENDEENMLYYIQKLNNDTYRNMAMSVRCQKEE